MRNLLCLTVAIGLLAGGCSNSNNGSSSGGVTGSTNQTVAGSSNGGSHGSTTSGTAASSGSNTSNSTSGSPTGSTGTTATIGTTGSSGTSASGGVCATLPDGTLCGQDDAGAGECCGSGCVSLGSADNCGGCGVSCPSGSACLSGPSTGSYCEDTVSPSRATCPLPGDLTSPACAAGTACISLAPQPLPDGGPGSPSYRSNQVELSAGCVTTTCDASAAGDLCDAAGQEGRCCSGACVAINSTTSGSACGFCGVTCPTGQFCDNLVCTPVPTCSAANLGLNCPAADGTLGGCCGSGCVDLNTDATNCGNCGVACPVGEVCFSGSCAFPDGGYPDSCDPFLPPDPAPPHPAPNGSCPTGTTCEGQNAIACDVATCAAGDDGDQCAGADPIWTNNACCGTQCVDIAVDDQNCGGCGNACGAGSFCANATCLAIPMCSASNANFAECPVSDGGLGTCCAAGCTDLQADPNNCGECDVQCPSGVTCGDGYCEGLGSCADAGCATGFECVSQFDEAECVPATCQSSYPSGPCAASDSAPGACCASGCVDLQADSNNCGQCGHACTGGFCDQGACAPTVDCATAATNTACLVTAGDVGSCCPAGCVDTTSDATNCGGCGVTCPTGATCSESSCSNYCGYDGTGTCPGSTTCLADEGICLLSICGAADNGDSCTPDGESELTCCGSVCDDLSSDSANCGTCGVGCDAGEDCLFGSCQPTVACSAANVGTECSTGHSSGTCCPTGCADTDTDPANCGGCGEVCPSGQQCNGFSCGFLDAGFPSNGCSGVTCASGTTCWPNGEGGGVCLPTSCAGQDGETCAVDGGELGAEFETCCGGACLNLETDDANCGTCGSPCGAGSFCDEGTCATSPVCSTNTQGEACPVNASSVGICCGTGCVDTSSDTDNCGGCGYVCPQFGQCLEGSCELAGGSFILCSGGPDAGCPTGTACPTNENVCYPETCTVADQSTCATGATTGACCASGPCTNTQTDNNNCGFCGNPCTGGTTCMNGGCQ